ncbi:hypothetical protein OC844_007817, partial [Tilletia horrida]
MIPDKLAEETLQDYVQRGCTLKLVCKQFARATTQHFRQHFHAFGPPHPVTAVDYPWHPPSTSLPLRAEFWANVYGSKWQRSTDLAKVKRSLSLTTVPSLRILSLDLRRLPTFYELHCNGLPTSDRTNAATVLTRLLMAARNLEELNLRMSPDQEAIQLVEHLLCDTPTLRRVVLEVDYVGAVYPSESIIRLQNMVHEGITYQPLDRFVLRCPGISIECCDVRGSKSDFIYRLRNVKHFSISTRRLDCQTSSWQWLWDLFHRTPLLETCQFAVDFQPAGLAPSAHSDLSPLALRHLTDLAIEAPGVDTALLSALDAPRLANLRLSTNIHAGKWPFCRFNQFPALSTVSSWCPGPSALRLTRLGVPFCKFWRNLDEYHNYNVCHRSSFTAVIHAPSWAPLKTVVNDQDIKTFNLALPKMLKDEHRSFDIP